MRLGPTQPLAPPLYLSAVYACQGPEEANQLLSGAAAGYVYGRDGHPNADWLSEKCRQLHGAERAAIASSGMAAMAVALLSQMEQGDHLIASSLLYGRSLVLLAQEAPRLGMSCTIVDTCDLAATEAAFRPQTKLLVVETISNPLLRVADLSGLAQLAHARGARLLVDNTFAGPTICRPREFGADWIMESLTKTMNGHSDVILGLLCGPEDCWQRVPRVLSTWGLSSAPFDCWMVMRGLGTLALRMERASASALEVAEFLSGQSQVESVHYPGLAGHPDHQLARRQFGDRFGSIVSFTLKGGLTAVERFIRETGIAFCPSLGDLCTTLSHPESTSHRALSVEERATLGIAPGTVRLSVGVESSEFILEGLRRGLA